jgi:hypothetical protein
MATKPKPPPYPKPPRPPGEPPQNPLSQLLIELSRVFAAVPQTSEDERNGYIMALVEMARFVREAARSTQDTGLWEAQLRLSELAYALRDLDNGQVAPALRRTKRKAGSPPDSSVTWFMRVRVLVALDALRKSGMTQEKATSYITTKYPELRRLMTRGRDLPGTIKRWRRELEDAKQGTFLAIFAQQMIDMEIDVRNISASMSMTPDRWRQFAENILARI